MGFFRQEYWSRLPFPLPADLPGPGIEPASPAALALAGEFFTAEPPGKPEINLYWLNLAYCLQSKLSTEELMLLSYGVGGDS